MNLIPVQLNSFSCLQNQLYNCIRVTPKVNTVVFKDSLQCEYINIFRQQLTYLPIQSHIIMLKTRFSFTRQEGKTRFSFVCTSFLRIKGNHAFPSHEEKKKRFFFTLREIVFSLHVKENRVFPSCEEKSFFPFV